MKNIPYKKIYNELGEVENPITKNNPYISVGSIPLPDGKRFHFPTRHQRHRKVRPFNNRKGGGYLIQVVEMNGVTKIIKHTRYIPQ